MPDRYVTTGGVAVTELRLTCVPQEGSSARGARRAATAMSESQPAPQINASQSE
jgi:hypothetical protein